jgi:periplasmic protein TonB
VYCADCETNGLAVPRHCACCGRPLASGNAEPQAGRCDRCGAAAGEEPLCAACQQAFQGVLGKTQKPAPSAELIAAEPAGEPFVEPVAEAMALWEEPEATFVPTEAFVLDEDVQTGALTLEESVPEEATVASWAPAFDEPLKSLPHEEANHSRAVVAPVAAPAPVAPIVTVPATLHETVPPIRTEARPGPAAPRPAPRVRPKPAAASRSVVTAAAAVVILAAVGVPLAQWVARGAAATAVHPAAPAPPANQPASLGAPLAPPSPDGSREPLSALGRAYVSPLPQATPAPNATVLPKAATPPKPRAKNSRKAKPPVQQPKPLVSNLAAPAPAALALAPVAEPVAPPPPAAAVPVGPLFEMRQVDEQPRVTAQVEPRVPDDLRARPINDVVVLRVLVSQTGRAADVNVLRKSKSGAGLDAAVVAAVRQWTFSPARKKGQPVSCWYNVGVPLRAQ